LIDFFDFKERVATASTIYAPCRKIDPDCGSRDEIAAHASGSLAEADHDAVVVRGRSWNAARRATRA
jgi:hypothetical protein